MSNESVKTPAEILIELAVRSVGKREFLKTVERLFKTNSSKSHEKRVKTPAAVENPCVARVKGPRTGLKFGRHVMFESARCCRNEIDAQTHLCAIHTNQVRKFGGLAHGIASEPLTEEQGKVFVFEPTA